MGYKPPTNPNTLRLPKPKTTKNTPKGRLGPLQPVRVAALGVATLGNSCNSPLRAFLSGESEGLLRAPIRFPKEFKSFGVVLGSQPPLGKLRVGYKVARPLVRNI